MKKKILVEGWRFIPHSYACVNMWQCLEFLKRDEIEFYHQDRPFYRPHWEPAYQLFDAAATAALGALRPLEGAPDVLFRMDYPYRFSPENAGRQFVFGTSEYGLVKESQVAGNQPLAQAMAQSEAVVVTPSSWSRAGFLRSGAPAERVVVVPHGVDTALFRARPEPDRAALRNRMGWQDNFVFLNIGSMTGNKGISYLLNAFVVLQQRFPRIKLCLKGLDPMYSSLGLLQEAAHLLSPEEIGRLQASLVYLGDNMSFADMAGLYNACDCYVSPYIAEGFNLPVLEAAACGLPVVCTAGGPTDDFVHESFARKIESSVMEGENGILGLQPDLDHLIALMAELVECGGFGPEQKALASSRVAASHSWGHAVDRLLAAFLAS